MAKAYLWGMLLFGALTFMLSTRPGGLALSMILILPLAPSLIVVFGYSYHRRLLWRGLWRVLLVLVIVNHVGGSFVDARIGVSLVSWAIWLPADVFLYRYAFRSDETWSRSV
jgi:hypothetical protein